MKTALAVAMAFALAWLGGSSLGGDAVSPKLGGTGVSPVLPRSTGKMPVPPASLCPYSWSSRRFSTTGLPRRSSTKILSLFEVAFALYPPSFHTARFTKIV